MVQFCTNICITKIWIIRVYEEFYILLFQGKNNWITFNMLITFSCSLGGKSLFFLSSWVLSESSVRLISDKSSFEVSVRFFFARTCDKARRNRMPNRKTLLREPAKIQQWIEHSFLKIEIQYMRNSKTVFFSLRNYWSHEFLLEHLADIMCDTNRKMRFQSHFFITSSRGQFGKGIGKYWKHYVITWQTQWQKNKKL